MIQNSSEKGYIAIISSIIISGVLMTVVFTLSFKGFNTRFNFLDAEHKKQSLNFAEACVNTAVLKIIEFGVSYIGETITFGDEECAVTVTGVGPFIIQAKSSVPKGGARKAVSNVKVTLNSDFSITEWIEVPVF